MHEDDDDEVFLLFLTPFPSFPFSHNMAIGGHNGHRMARSASSPVDLASLLVDLSDPRRGEILLGRQPHQPTLGATPG